MRRFTIPVIVTFCLLITVPGAGDFIPDKAKVVAVLSGDMVKIEYGNGKTRERVHLKHVRATFNEKEKQDNRLKGYAERFASAYLSQMLVGKTVLLEYDGRSRSADGTLQAYLFIVHKNDDPENSFVVGRTNVNADIIRKGCALYTGKSAKYHSILSDSQQYARRNNLIIWADTDEEQKMVI